MPMKLLLLALFLVVVAGCATHKHSQHEPDFKAAIQRVLDERRDIRTVISHPPRDEAELAGIARMNPDAQIFNVEDFALRLPTISLKGCPADFRDAFGAYVTAWTERAAANPAVLLLVSPGPQLPSSDAPVQPTETAWKAVQAVCTQYGIAAE